MRYSNRIACIDYIQKIINKSFIFGKKLNIINVPPSSISIIDRKRKHIKLKKQFRYN